MAKKKATKKGPSTSKESTLVRKTRDGQRLRIVEMTASTKTNDIGDRCGFVESDAVALINAGQAKCVHAGPDAWHLDDKGNPQDGVKPKPKSQPRTSKK